MDDKQKFTLHFVMKERAHANTQDTSDIKYEGKIRSGASTCWISFPGKFAAGWDALVAELHGDSVACVFLSTPESGLGQTPYVRRWKLLLQGYLRGEGLSDFRLLGKDERT